MLSRKKTVQNTVLFVCNNIPISQSSYFRFLAVVKDYFPVLLLFPFSFVSFIFFFIHIKQLFIVEID
jgi:hypothetical protein